MSAPFVQAKNHGPADNKPIFRIVMHGTVSECVAGGARSVALMFAHTTRDASTQWVHDPAETYQCVAEGTVAYGAPPNEHEIHHELCDMQYEHPTAKQRKRWKDALHQSMLRRAAGYVARDCLKYSIPVVKLSSTDLLAGKRGICGHKDVSDAWHQTTHVDPGPDFPWSQFLGMVRAAMAPKPTPTPTPAPTGDPDMPTPYHRSGTRLQHAPAGKWVDLEWDKTPTNGPTICGGDDKKSMSVVASVGATLSAPVSGSLRFVEAKPKTFDLIGAIGKSEPTDGTVIGIDRALLLGAGAPLLRCQFKPDADVDIVARNTTTLAWRP